VCKCVLPLVENPTAVNKYITSYHISDTPHYTVSFCKQLSHSSYNFWVWCYPEIRCTSLYNQLLQAVLSQLIQLLGWKLSWNQIRPTIQSASASSSLTLHIISVLDTVLKLAKSDYTSQFNFQRRKTQQEHAEIWSQNINVNYFFQGYNTMKFGRSGGIPLL